MTMFSFACGFVSGAFVGATLMCAMFVSAQWSRFDEDADDDQ